jgi:hydroxymethylpyrimidine/phosphomethylpyrimidine kinase
MKIVLSIAGSDSSGGAGVQADLQAIAAQGCHGATAITAITAQSPDRVHRVFAVPPEQLRAQLHALAEVDLAAIKTGMLASAELVDVVADFIESRDLSSVPLVVDPVFRSSSGHALLEADGIECLVRRVFPLVEVLTPNAIEAEVLLGCEVRTEKQATHAVQAIAQLGPGAVVLKGGHLQTEQVVDLVWDGHVLHRFERPRLKTSEVHGTGCVHASTLASLLALGVPLNDAVGRTQEHLSRGVTQARCLGSVRVVEPSPGAKSKLLG